MSRAGRYRSCRPSGLHIQAGLKRCSYAAGLLLLALIALMAVSFSPLPASAQALSVTDEGIENRFPGGLEFSVSAQADQSIEEIRLHYTVLPDGTAASGVPDFQSGAQVSATFTLAGSETPQLYLPPGTRIRYFWEVTDGAGNTATTPDQSIVYEDVRFDWRTLEADGVVLHYYSGSDADAQAMLDVAQETISRMTDTLAAEIDFPVNVRIYASTEDMRPALQRRSESYEERVITAGVRVSSDTVLVLGNVSFDTLRHELTHVVTAIAGEGPFGDLPAWLDEGTAVYAQSDPGGFRGAIESAVERGNVLSVRSITSYQGDPSRVNLFYGQSWSLVSFLVDTYGEEKFAKLFAEIKSGHTTDAALEAVYGFDQSGLENEWRESVGLAPKEPSSDDEEPAAPTAAPTDSDEADRPVASEDDGGASVGVVIGLIAAAAVFVGVIAFAAAVLRRRFG